MSARRGRPRTRSTRVTPVEVTGDSDISTEIPSVGEHLPPRHRSRARSRSTLNRDLPTNWSAAKLCAELLNFGIALPTSTPNKTLVRVYEQLKAQRIDCGGSASPSRDDFTPTPLQQSAPHHTPEIAIPESREIQDDGPHGQLTDIRNQDSNNEIAGLRTELLSVQASLAELSRRLTCTGAQELEQPTASRPPGTVTLSFSSMAPSTTPTRVPVDSLPEVNLVTSKVRAAIHAHRHVNLALLLIPGMDSDSQTKIVDQAGNQIVVQASDARLQRQLTINEFRVAFSRFKKVLFEREPERRQEMDDYSDLIDSLYITYGHSYFYEYHNAFSRKAEQYQTNMNIDVDWGARDTALFLRIFSGLKSATCDYCASGDHTSGFCPSASQFSREQPAVVPPPYNPPTARHHASYVHRAAPSRSVDSKGRERLFHKGKEICNNFNTPAGCNYIHNFDRIAHWCSVCKLRDHAAPKCPRRVGESHGEASRK